MNKRIKILKAFFKNIKSQIAFIVLCVFLISVLMNLFLKKIKKINNELKSKTTQENAEIITQVIAQNPDLQKALENQEEKYSIKMATNIKEFYKQGIIDGITLMINVLKYIYQS